VKITKRQRKQVKLYILYESIPYEGGWVHGIFSSAERAQSHLNALEADDSPPHSQVASCNLDELIKGDFRGLMI
jgi:hypothetical protein